MQVIYAGHARKRMNERGITEEEVERIISKGMKWFIKNEGENGRWHAKMGNIETVYERDEEHLVVVTVYWGEA